MRRSEHQGSDTRHVQVAAPSLPSITGPTVRRSVRSNSQGGLRRAATLSLGTSNRPSPNQSRSGSKESRHPLGVISSSRPTDHGSWGNYTTDDLMDGPERRRREVKTKTLSPENLTIAKVHLLSRKYRLDALDVKRMLDQFDIAFAKSSNDTMDLPMFRDTLRAIFGKKDLDESVVMNAWRATAAGAKSHEESSKMMTAFEAFLSWYVVNMFTQVNQLTGDQDRVISDSLVYNLSKKHRCSAYAMDKIKQRFDEFDTDKSGKIDTKEFQDMMMKILNVKKASDISEDRMQRWWSEIDADASGLVDFSEFTAWYLKYFDPETESAMGPLEAFYFSFNPDVQRHTELHAQVMGGGPAKHEKTEKKEE